MRMGWDGGGVKYYTTFGSGAKKKINKQKDCEEKRQGLCIVFFFSLFRSICMDVSAYSSV